MGLMNEMVREVEFSTSYPNRDGKGFTSITIVRLEDDTRILIWSPYIEKLDANISVKESWDEARGRYNLPLGKILYSRYIEFNGAAYASQSMDDGFYFKAFCLDDYSMKPKISKSEIEKLFNCQVVD